MKISKLQLIGIGILVLFIILNIVLPILFKKEVNVEYISQVIR